jgi:hypothetical protein
MNDGATLPPLDHPYIILMSMPHTSILTKGFLPLVLGLDPLLVENRPLQNKRTFTATEGST